MQEMAETNFSRNSSMLDSNSTSFSVPQKECLLFDVNFHTTQFLYVTHILTAVVNSLFSFTATAGNAVVILTVWRSPSLHTPSNTLICCLAVSDLTVGLLTQPCFVVHKIGEILHNFQMYCITRVVSESLGSITAGVSGLTMAAATIERYLALYFHLRYNEIVTVKRVLIVVSSFWIFLVTLATFRLLLLRPELYNTILVTTISLSLLLTYLVNVKIMKCVRMHEQQIQAECTSARLQTEEKTSRLRDMLRYKKSTVTMIIVVGIFTLCFLPMLCVKLAHRLSGYTVRVKVSYLFASTITFLNSSINPLVYCWRIKTLRNAVKSVLKQLKCKKDKIIPSLQRGETQTSQLTV